MKSQIFRPFVVPFSILAISVFAAPAAQAGFLPLGPTDIINGGGVTTSDGGGGGLIPDSATHYHVYSAGAPTTYAIGDVIANADRIIISVQASADGLGQSGTQGAFAQAITDVIFAVDTSGPYTLSWTLIDQHAGVVLSANSIVRFNFGNAASTPGTGSTQLNLLAGTYYIIGAVANGVAAGQAFPDGAGAVYRGALLTLEATPAPEPATMLLLGAGLSAAVLSRRATGPRCAR